MWIIGNSELFLSIGPAAPVDLPYDEGKPPWFEDRVGRGRRRRTGTELKPGSIGLAVVVLSLLAAPWSTAQTVSVTATVETDPVPNGGDAADDAAIWIHPTDPALSTILGTDKRGGIAVYDLSGQQIQYLPDGRMNNVDLRYNFPLGGESIALVTASNRTDDTLAVYTVDPRTRMLRNVAADSLMSGLNVYGSCMYRSASTGEYYNFVNSNGGGVEQWRLFDNGSGGVTGTRVRTLNVGSIVEGCVADDVLGDFYIGEENVGIWKYGAEPGDGEGRTSVDVTGSQGHLVADVEGLTLYYATGGRGYLIASSQGNDTFVLYERGRRNTYVATFEIVPGAIDGVDDTDGIDVTNAPLGPAFPDGVFIAQDGTNPGANQNYKLVRWDDIATAVDPPLRIDLVWDPRGVPLAPPPPPGGLRVE